MDTRLHAGEIHSCRGNLSVIGPPPRIRELFLAKLSQLGYDQTQFGLHSLRAGGATAAASAGVPDRLFKRHGRWRSETAKYGYVKDPEEVRLSVSKGLNL